MLTTFSSFPAQHNQLPVYLVTLSDATPLYARVGVYTHIRANSVMQIGQVLFS